MNFGKIAALVAIAVALAAAFLFLPVREWSVLLQSHIQSLGAVGPAAFVIVYVLSTVFLIPGSVLTIASGSLFGLPLGFLVVFLGANLGALFSFLLGRTLLRRKVESWAAAHPKFHALDQAMGRQDFKIVLLMRLSPVFPFVLLNYFLGLTAVRIAAYIAASALGMLPAMVLFVYAGAAAGDALASEPGRAGFYLQVLEYLGLAATAAVVWVATRMARRALRRAEEQQEGSFLMPDPSRQAENGATALAQKLLMENAHDRRLLENCRPPSWVNPTPADRYNLLVVGGGTAGLVSAAGAAALGAKVALIERDLLGGDCLNTGCVPSKALIKAARAAHDARSASALGVQFPCAPQAVFSQAMERMRRLRADISAHDSAERFRRLGVDVFIGQGKFAGPSTVEVDGKRLEFARAVIATGSRPREPALPGLAQAGYLTNETVFALTHLPKRIAVIGAGAIGCELAQAFSRFGAEVFLIEALHGILPGEDRDATEIVYRSLAGNGGVKLLCCGKELQISQGHSGDKRLTLESHGQKHEIAVNEILVAAGRSPNVEGLGLEAAAVAYAAQGVLVNERLRTTNPRIFAAGDVCSKYKFTHAADAMARVAIANALFWARRKVTDQLIPRCTYTDPEIAHVGYYEDDARAAGYDPATITVSLQDIDRAVLDGESDGLAKVHYDRRNGRILGGTVVARHAGEMIGELALAMTAKQSMRILSSTIHPYPTQAEVLRKIGDAYMRTKLTPFVKSSCSRWLAWRRR
jgi:pyruvate/2-oxoglutarate dehydrogenase complex dihydrolipoamide dehydrogenase (E3) component/uncharacterized membrane protein YdjX (TVP38/TMEM64 family)